MVETEKAEAKRSFPSRFFQLSDSQVALGCWVRGRSSSYAINQELQQSLPWHVGCGMISNAGYVPTELNSADDPTRRVRVRDVAKPPCNWTWPPERRSVEDTFELFDRWLRGYQADVLTVSGVPGFDDLKQSFEEGFVLSSSRGSREFLQRNHRECLKRRQSKASQVLPLRPMVESSVQGNKPELSANIDESLEQVGNADFLDFESPL